MSPSTLLGFLKKKFSSFMPMVPFYLIPTKCESSK